jgi:hypothetical protein
MRPYDSAPENIRHMASFLFTLEVVWKDPNHIWLQVGFSIAVLHPPIPEGGLLLELSHDENDKDLDGGRQPLRTPSDVKLVLASRMIKDKIAWRMERTGNTEAK